MRERNPFQVGEREDLDARQIHAVIDVLLLVMYADNKATLLEKAEFEDAICALPVLYKGLLYDAQACAEATALVADWSPGERKEALVAGRLDPSGLIPPSHEQEQEQQA